MNSFRLTAVGDLARNPELSIKGDITFARFCLVGNDEVSEAERDGPRGSCNESLVLSVRRNCDDHRARFQQRRPAHSGSESHREPLDRQTRGEAARPYVHCDRLPLRCATWRTRIADCRSARLP